MRLLEFLDGLQGPKAMVKPTANSDEYNCVVWPIAKRFPHLRVVDTHSLAEVLERYAPRAILLDVPSTPLYEILPLDVEIFMMNDYIYPFEAEALAALRKRVHFTEDIDEMTSYLSSFIEGTLPQKRDTTFLDHYVCRPEPEQHIVKLLKMLME
jgi:hypothetical protein